MKIIIEITFWFIAFLSFMDLYLYTTLKGIDRTKYSNHNLWFKIMPISVLLFLYRKYRNESILTPAQRLLIYKEGLKLHLKWAEDWERNDEEQIGLCFTLDLAIRDLYFEKKIDKQTYTNANDKDLPEFQHVKPFWKARHKFWWRTSKPKSTIRKRKLQKIITKLERRINKGRI